jgi:hypothetical protein
MPSRNCRLGLRTIGFYSHPEIGTNKRYRDSLLPVPHER